MSGCFPSNTCHHVDGEFCDRCYKPECNKVPTIELPAFSGFDRGRGDELVLFCTNCKIQLDNCNCVWAAIREINREIVHLKGTSIDGSHIFQLRQEIARWQEGCEEKLCTIMKSEAELERGVNARLQTQAEINNHHKCRIDSLKGAVEQVLTKQSNAEENWRIHLRRHEEDRQWYGKVWAELNQRIEMLTHLNKKFYCPVHNPLDGEDMQGGTCVCVLTESKDHSVTGNDQITFNEADRIVKAFAESGQTADEVLQENASAVFWYNESNKFRGKFVHLERCLRDRNAQIKDLQEKYQELQTALGKRNNECQKALNDMNAAIANDRQSREVNEKYRKMIHEYQTSGQHHTDAEMEKERASHIMRISHLSEALDAQQRTINELQAKVNYYESTESKL